MLKLFQSEVEGKQSAGKKILQTLNEQRKEMIIEIVKKGRVTEKSCNLQE